MPHDPDSIDTIDQAIAAMDAEIERCVADRSAAGYFAVVYRAVTARVRDGIADREFDDNERMERLDVMFARRYLSAVHGWRTGRAIPDVWRVAFETAASRRRHLVAQHLLLGINAHINLDLGVAAALAAADTDIDELKADFDHINDVLADLVDRMQSAVSSVSIGTRVLDVVGMRLDEALVTFNIRHARADAWEFATLLSRQAEPARDALVAARDREMTELARKIARPGWPVRWVVAAARATERDDLERVIAELAG